MNYYPNSLSKCNSGQYDWCKNSCWINKATWFKRKLLYKKCKLTMSQIEFTWFHNWYHILDASITDQSPHLQLKPLSQEMRFLIVIMTRQNCFVSYISHKKSKLVRSTDHTCPVLMMTVNSETRKYQITTALNIPSSHTSLMCIENY